MRALPFLKYSPCGNMTLLILEREGEALFNALERAAVAAEIIAPEHLGAEQAAFVRPDLPLPRLEMMGGEFCLNATRAFAALLLEEGRLRPQKDQDEPEGLAEGLVVGETEGESGKAEGGSGVWHSGEVSVSGLAAPVRVFARRKGEQVIAAVRLARPGPEAVQKLAPGLHLVRLPGIAHLVLDAALHPLPSPWQGQVAELLHVHELEGEDAAGCVWLRRPASSDEAAPQAKQSAGQGQPSLWSLTPFVRVRATGTTCAESACGSGTLAAALVLAQNKNEQTSPLRSFRQVSGDVLSVALNSTTARVEGGVRLIAKGDVYVSCLSGAGECKTAPAAKGTV